MSFLESIRQAYGGQEADAAPADAPRPLAEPGGTAYGKAALAAETETVAAAANGTRNHQLNTAALKLSRLVAGGELDEADVRQALARAAADAGLDQGETLKTIASGLGAGKVQPRQAPADWQPGAPVVIDMPEGVEVDGPSPWPPRPAPLGTPPPPPLPLDACGPVLGPAAQLAADVLQVPTDAAITLGLSIAATAAQGTRTVRINPNWSETLSISTTSVMRSGERKSALVSLLTKPLEAAENELRDAEAERVTWRAEERTLAEERVKAARKAAVKDRSKEPELRAEMQAAEQLEELHPPRLLADDVTAEVLPKLMSQQGGAIGVISAEPGFFATMAGRYSAEGTANLDAVLKGTSGEAIRVDRVTREPLVVRNPCLTITLCIQPGLLDELAKKPELRYAGFLARFLYVMPAPMVGTRHTSSVDYVDCPQGVCFYNTITYSDTLDTPGDVWWSRIHALAHTSFSRKTATQSTQPTAGLNPPPGGQPRDITLSDDARETLAAFQAEIEPRLHPDRGDLTPVADWGAKLPGVAARIAGALALLDDPDTRTIDATQMANAVRLARGYITHAVAVLETIRGQGDGLEEARDVLALARRRGWARFTQRDVHRQLEKTPWVKNAPKAADAVREAIDVLAHHGYVRLVDDGAQDGAGRRRSPTYEVHPDERPKEQP